MALPIPPLDFEIMSMPMFFDLNPNTFFQGIQEVDVQATKRKLHPNFDAAFKEKKVEVDEASLEKKLQATRRKLHANYDAAFKEKRQKKTQSICLEDLPKPSPLKPSKINGARKSYGMRRVVIC